MIPILIQHPTRKELIFPTSALVDTGADSCVFPVYVSAFMGYNLKSGNHEISHGIGDGGMKTWKHEFIIHLRHPNNSSIIYTLNTRK